jgi:hypothetical protein
LAWDTVAMSPASCRFFIRKPDILRTLRLMHDGRSFDKILPKQVGYVGTRINCIQPTENREFGHNARSATSRFNLEGS